MASTVLVWEAAAAIYPSSNPPSAGWTGGANFPWLSLNFDKDISESCYFFGVLPQVYGGGASTIRLFWTAPATGNVVWNVQQLGRVDDEVLDAALAAATAVTDSVTAINDLMVASLAIASPGLAAGDFLVLRVLRDAINGSDTVAADAKLLAVEFQED